MNLQDAGTGKSEFNECLTSNIVHQTISTNISDQVVNIVLNLSQGHLSVYDIEYLLLSST